MSAQVSRPRRGARACTAVGVTVLIAAGGWTLARGNHSSAPVAAIPIVNTGTVPGASPITLPNTSSNTSSNTSAHFSSPPVPTPTSSAAQRAQTVRPMAAAGAQLDIPRLGVSAQIVGIGVTNRTLDVPLDPKVLGWWTGSAKPGSGTGSVVIDGHINYNGVAGALSVLPQLHVGDRVTMTRGADRLVYRITAVRTYVKAGGLPADIFGQDVAERLVLVTCGGPFDASTGNYEDNIVAYATPESASP